MNGRRYAAVMLIAAAAIIATSGLEQAPAQHGRVAVQAVATIRVISGATLHLDGKNDAGQVPAPRETIYYANGIEMPAKLIEFE